MQDIYACNPTTHRIQYTQAGYTSLATFDWSLGNGKTPSVRLYLPDDAIGKNWAIQVEAFNVLRNA